MLLGLTLGHNYDKSGFSLIIRKRKGKEKVSGTFEIRLQSLVIPASYIQHFKNGLLKFLNKTLAVFNKRISRIITLRKPFCWELPLFHLNRSRTSSQLMGVWELDHVHVWSYAGHSGDGVGGWSYAVSSFLAAPPLLPFGAGMHFFYSPAHAGVENLELKAGIRITCCVGLLPGTIV